jgi:hypothetical protein
VTKFITWFFIANRITNGRIQTDSLCLFLTATRLQPRNIYCAANLFIPYNKWIKFLMFLTPIWRNICWISRPKCVDIRTDRARSKMRKRQWCTQHASLTGTCKNDKNVPERHVRWNHKTVNHTTSKQLNATLLQIICEGIGTEHTALLLNTEITWLSRSFVQNCLLSL